MMSTLKIRTCDEGGNPTVSARREKNDFKYVKTKNPKKRRVCETQICRLAMTHTPIHIQMRTNHITSELYTGTAIFKL